MDVQTQMMKYSCVLSKFHIYSKTVSQNDVFFHLIGFIINTLAYRKEGYKQLLHIAKSFEVDVILVLDKELLYNSLLREMRNENIKVVWLPKSNGVVERDEKQRSDEIHNSIKRYFYGFNNTLIPHTYDVKFDDLKVT